MRNTPVLFRSLHHRHLVMAVQTDNSECVSHREAQIYFYKDIFIKIFGNSHVHIVAVTAGFTSPFLVFCLFCFLIFILLCSCCIWAISSPPFLTIPFQFAHYGSDSMFLCHFLKSLKECQSTYLAFHAQDFALSLASAGES